MLLTEVTVPVLTTEQLTVVSVEDVVHIQDQVDINRCVTQVMCQEKWLKSLGGACSEILNSIRYFFCINSQLYVPVREDQRGHVRS